VVVEKLKLWRTLPGIDFAVPRALVLLRQLALYSQEIDGFIKGPQRRSQALGGHVLA
jgi:hypothetical protein